MYNEIKNIKDLLLHESICVLPWHGFMLFPNGEVKNCAISNQSLGNIHKTFLPDLLDNEINQRIRQDMRDNVRHNRCITCYRTEDLQPNGNFSNKISNRIWYMKVMKNHDVSVYSENKFVKPRVLDLRWRNTCNMACVYCGPDLSSKWASELENKSHVIDEAVFEKNKQFILDNLQEVRHIYLAGGEPLLIKDNEDLLNRLLIDNPDVTIRINSNLSKINNKIFYMLTEKFPGTKWTVSLDSTGENYEYVRYPGVWADLVQNLKILKQITNNIDFNMTWSILNAYAIFDAVDFLENDLGFQNSTFVIQPIFDPPWLFINNLDDQIIRDIKDKINARLAKTKSGLYRNSLNSMLTCLDIPWNKDIDNSKTQLDTINQRRNLTSPDFLNYINFDKRK